MQRALECLRQLRLPLRRGVLQSAHKISQTRGWHWCIDLNDGIDKRINRCHASGFITRSWSVLVHRIQPNPRSASWNSQQAVIMHRVQQARSCVRRSSPIVLDRTVSEMTIDLLGMNHSALPHEFQHKLGALSPAETPRNTSLSCHPGGESRMHQRLQLARYESVVDEEVFVDVEFGVAALQISRAIAFDAMTQDQVLRASRRANRIGLHESHMVKSTFQRGRRQQTTHDRKAPQVVEGDRHPCMLSKSRGF